MRMLKGTGVSFKTTGSQGYVASLFIRLKHFWKSRWYKEHKCLIWSCVSMTLIVCFLYWYWLVVTDWGHGTFLPIFVWSQTSDYNANILIDSSDNRISSINNYHPTFRVVVTMTTMPHHLEYLSETIDSLLSQTLLPDLIYLNIPYGKARTGESYYVPKYLNKYIDNGGRLKILRCEKDYGPLTKIYPTLQSELDPNTLIISVDDDQIYDKNTIKYLAYHSEYSPNNAWSCCGWSFLKVPHKMKITRVYVPFLMRNRGGKKVDVIEGICGTAYRRKFFPNLDKLENYPQECKTTDDIWMAGYLQFINDYSIDRVLIKDNIAPKKTQWKLNNEDWTKTLMNHNIKNVDTRIKCIRAIETLFNKIWIK